MTTDSWINETLYPDWGQRFLVKRELARVQSAFQDIVIFDSFSHGRVMALDGVIQITERDEFVYQEMLTHVPLLAHGAAASVLIIGAGDGGVLRRVLQHRGVKRAVMVEIDGEVIRLAKEFLPAIGGDAWGDISVDKHVDAGSGKRLASCGGASGADEGRGVGRRRASQRHQHFQIRVKSFELLNSREISIERSRVRVAVHAGQVG